MIVHPNEAGLAQALHALQQGQVIGLPTETVYGLAADAEQDAAVAQIYARKGRPRNHPLIVHVHDAQVAQHFAAELPDFARVLMQAFWPGPLTLIVPRRAGVAEAAAAGHATVGLRSPSHPVARRVLQLGLAAEPPVRGIAAPSANRFGRVSPTRASHVQEELGADLLVLDGGDCDVGIESTIVDCSRGRPVVLRPGHITAEQIAQTTGLPVAGLEDEEQAADVPQAPGTLTAHYAPQAKVRLMDAEAIQTALHVLGAQGRDLAVYARTPVRSASPQVTVQRMPATAQATAQELFRVLRDFDAQGVKLIWVETPPPTAEWDGVRDRLARAAASA
ncbi:threonylcarbamoyl-AMP synthase [Allofranklinella schreckenbergeri]|uniref:Threonylcarbamoyl-AMP synthase n=1 Tax=Allofranklinella schreckenbergeri TaxID=1076744 RepID=A0A3M6R2C7_9BURK|nr:L-threonylcarbamoyladenylate synthase [Allofranklinella schreckenbergeri]RMX09375.1 threonylcarbamoyl-AMP synthase [Allofranklinella schreckenbergeri]